MLKRIYIDNFRCLVNFELSVDSINLFLGSNGAGKSTVFEVLRKIQDFVSGDGKVEAIFNHLDCTRWQKSLIQSFELEIEGNGGTYKYELAIEHDRDKDRNGKRTSIKHERLWFDRQLLLIFELGEVRLYTDNNSEVQRYPFDLFQSMLILFSSQNNHHLNWFKKRMERFIILQINPTMMVNQSNQEETQLSYTMKNYVSWYRYLSQDQGKIFELTTTLKEIFEGFTNFKFVDAGQGILILKLLFSIDSDRNKKSVEYKLGELSDGQRMLIALYTLIICTKSEDYTLCLDEPENFLALPEIQPWLIQLYDLCSEQKTQALLISHHPVLIDYLLASPVGYWFERQSNTPVRVKRIGSDNDTGLPISELVARGWLYDS